ncbi:MAG: V-type ATP synthase subunit A [Planctomycetota bacterium]
MRSATSATGVVSRVNGPIVEAREMAGVGAFEVVRVGPDRLVGEVLSIAADVATIQVYEDTGGLQPGMEVRPTGAPLSATLAPGLVGDIYDGIQRPLDTLARKSGRFLRSGVHAEPLDTSAEWAFTPTVETGDRLGPTDVFGEVEETPSITHRLMVPHGSGGAVSEVAEEGKYTIEDTVCVLEDEDGEPVELNMVQRWPMRRARPFRERRRGEDLLVTGQRVIDAFFPVARGGTAAVPGDFGTGKTILQQQFAKWSDADLVVYVGCGERGNEMTDILLSFPQLEDPRTGRSLMERTVLIANTSNMPVAAREVSIYAGVTVAEYYRDMGYAVALMADSTSRWAEALREASSRLEQMPAEEGFPPYLEARLAEFYERAGLVENLNGRVGSVTVMGSVSPPGGDFSEPVTQHTTRFTRCFWALDRDLADKRHYPAVGWMDSYSEYLEQVEGWWQERNPDWHQQRERMMNLLSEEDDLQQIVQLVGEDVLPDRQRLVLMTADMFKSGFLQQNAMSEVDTYCSPAKQMGLLRAFVQFHDRAESLIEQGATIGVIRELDIVTDLRRAKGRIANEDEEAMQDLLSRLDGQFRELEEQYQ